MAEESSIYMREMYKSTREKLELVYYNRSLGQPRSCIYKVHQRIRKIDEDSYTPDMFSIGPYRRGMINFQATEDLKLPYVLELLDRTRERTSLDDYKKALRELEDEARWCYSEVIGISGDEFVEMMLFDGLFIIELFRKNSKFVPVDDNDSIFHSNSWRARVVRDLVLLENQIPMFVLQKLFDLSKDPNNDSLSLIEMALLFFHDLIPQSVDMHPQDDVTIRHNHLLDLLRNTLCSSLVEVKMPASGTTLEYLPSVTELHSEVEFKKSLQYGSLIDIKFEAGVIEIPPLCVDINTESFFRNLIAYEQYVFGGKHYITSYAILMDYLIKSADDVAILRERGIIINLLGDDRKVLVLFKYLCSEISNRDFYYSELCQVVKEYHKRVKEYRNRRTQKWKVILMREYCDTPWKIISVVGGILLLILTAWGALFTTFPFFNVHA